MSSKKFDTSLKDPMAMPVTPVDPDEVMSRVKRLWKSGMQLIVGTHVQDPQAQQQLYRDIHAYCS
jgi:hypothetical protein